MLKHQMAGNMLNDDNSKRRERLMSIIITTNTDFSKKAGYSVPPFYITQ